MRSRGRRTHGPRRITRCPSWMPFGTRCGESLDLCLERPGLSWPGSTSTERRRRSIRRWPTLASWAKVRRGAGDAVAISRHAGRPQQRCEQLRGGERPWPGALSLKARSEACSADPSPGSSGASATSTWRVGCCHLKSSGLRRRCIFGSEDAPRQVKTNSCLTFLGPMGTHPQGRGLKGPDPMKVM